MGSKTTPNMWKEALNSLHFTDTLDIVKEKIAELNKNSGAEQEYTFEQFIMDCEAFYELYIDFIGFNEDKSPNKNLQVQFHKVARLLNMYGHVPDQVEEAATQSMFDYLSASNIDTPDNNIHTANSNNNQDDFYLQGNLAFGLENNMPSDTDETVDKIDMVKSKPKLTSCKVLRVKIASEALASDINYICKLAELYKIKKRFIESTYDRDNRMCSLYYV